MALTAEGIVTNKVMVIYAVAPSKTMGYASIANMLMEFCHS
jgi:hypothetical protein